jgi:hypothetical protein
LCSPIVVVSIITCIAIFSILASLIAFHVHTPPNRTGLLSANTAIWLRQVSLFFLIPLFLCTIGMRLFLRRAISLIVCLHWCFINTPISHLLKIQLGYSFLSIFGCAYWPSFRKYNTHELAIRSTRFYLAT